MALEPVSFLVLFVVLALGAWLLSNFMAKAVALLITLCTGNTVSFRLIGIFRLKDLSIDFKKGPIASLNIGEIKGKTRESLSPVLQMKGQGLKWRFALRDVEIVFRQPQPSSSKPKKRREKKQTASGAGRGKWRLLVNAARFFQVSITDVCIRTLQVPDGSFYSRELDLDIDQAGIGSTSLDIRFEIMPIHVLVRDTTADCADSGEESNGLMGGSFFSGKPADSAPPLFALEHFVTVVRLDYEREVGIVMKQLEVSCGDLAVDVSEQLLKLEVIRPERKKEVLVEAEPSPPEPTEVVPDLVQAVPANKQKQKSKNTKPSRLPEKVTFSMSLIRVTSSIKAHNLSMVHQIVGIRLQFPPPPPIDSISFPESSGAMFQTVQEDANSLPAVQLDLGDIQIGQIMDSSACITIVSIQKVSVQVALDLPQQEEDPLRVEAEVHLGGMRCSFMPTLLEPWVGAATSALKQPRKVHVGAPETPKSVPKKPPSKPRKLAWRATVSAPETRLVIFGASQQALYRVHMSTSHLFVCNTQRGGSSLEVTGELADFQVDMADEERPCPEEILIAGEASPTCVVKISQIAAQWGVTGITSGGEEEDRGGGVASDKLTLQLEVSEGGAYFSVPKLRAIVLNVVQLQRYLKNRKVKEGSAMGGAAAQAKKPGQRKKSGGGIKRIKFVLSRLELHMERMMVVEVGEVKEPKTVNFGCQGGRTTFTTYNEGLPRVAHLKMAEFEGLTMPKLKCQSRLEVSQITVVSELDDGQTSAQISSCNWKYHELTPDGDRLVEVKIFAAQSSDFVFRKPVAEVEFPGQVLVTSTGLELRYEHDPTLFFYQISLDVKAILHQRRRDEAASAEALAVANAAQALAAQALAHKSLHKQANGDSGSLSGRELDTWQPLNRSLSGLLPSSWGGNEILPLNTTPNLGSAVGGSVDDLPVSYGSFIDNDVVAKDSKEDSPTGLEKNNSVPKKKKAPLRVAVDIEGVRVCGALADGVEACFATQALFTEDVNVGFLLEGTSLEFNGATVFSTDSLQLSRSIARTPGSGAVSSKSQRRSSAELDLSSGEKMGTSGTEVEGISERKSKEVRGKGEGEGERVEPEADGPVVWDCLIQGSGVRVIMPFRLELRAIEDAVEDTIRALKLSMKGQARHYAQQGGQSRGGEEGTVAPRKKKKGSKIGTIRMVVRDIIGEIEEEPIQGWLDQHHRMMEKERRELIVREMLLEEQAPEMGQVAYSRRPSLENECHGGGSPGEGVGASGDGDGSEAEHLTPEAARQAWIKMHTRAFRSYKAACEMLSSDPGSGACTNSWQSGFSVSKERRALMFLRATTVDAELRCIEGGEEGQIQRIRELDSVSPSLNVPFSRTLGRNVDATFTGLVCQLRNYTFPLISAVTARLSGDLIFAQQATIFPRQFFQDTFVGRWRCVSMLRSISGATPPLKMYSDLNLELDCCECSYSVGYEPPLCDVSYAFSCALRKANLSPRAEGALLPHPALATSTHLLPSHPRPRSSNPTPNPPGTSGTPLSSARSSSQKQFRSRYAFFAGVPPNTVKKERSFPYWDDLRYYLHGKNRAWAKNWEIFLMATTDPYESENVMHMMADTFEVLQTEGRVFTETKGFRTTVSSGEILKLTGRGSGGSSGSPAPFLQAPIFQLELTMDWECESGTPLNHYLHAFPAEVVPRPQLLDPFRASAWAFGWNMRMKADPKVGSSATNAISESSESFFTDDLELFRQDSSRRSFGRDSSGRSLEDLLLRNVPQRSPLLRSPLRSPFIRSPSRGGEKNGSANGSPTYHDDEDSRVKEPTGTLGAHDLKWVMRWWGLYYFPPFKIRSFGRVPRFGIKRLARSGNLALSQLLAEMLLRVDCVPASIHHVPLTKDDPSEGLTLMMRQLKYEIVYSRGKKRYNEQGKREPLDTVYQGFDIVALRMVLVNPNEEDGPLESLQKEQQRQQRQLVPLLDCFQNMGGGLELPTEHLYGGDALAARRNDRGFVLSSDCLTVRKQAPKADPARLHAWSIGVERKGGAGYDGSLPKRPSIDNPHSTKPSHTGNKSDPASEDDGLNLEDEGLTLVLADNCLRVSLHGLKLLWTIPNRDAIWSWAGDLNRAFERRKPSPSRMQAARRKMEAQEKLAKQMEVLEPTVGKQELVSDKGEVAVKVASPQPSEGEGKAIAVLDGQAVKAEGMAEVNQEATASGVTRKSDADGEEGKPVFMINVIQPQFNLHSEDAHGRFLLAAHSGRVLARSFLSVLKGLEMLAEAIVQGEYNLGGQNDVPELSWKRREISVLLEHVQAHVAPTDVDPCAGIQWLPKISRGGKPRSKRTGSLLQRVFQPCTMYFQYTRHKGNAIDGKSDGKVKPLKELSFNSPNIKASMTSRQFHILVDVISTLLLARLPKARKNVMGQIRDEEEEETDDEEDEVVPEGVMEVEEARIKLESAERECRIVYDDLCTMRRRTTEGHQIEGGGACVGISDVENLPCMVCAGRHQLSRRLERDLAAKHKARRAARAKVRSELRVAAKNRQEKSKHPSSAMRISWAIDRAAWELLVDGVKFSEAEISHMILMVDRHFNDVGTAKFTLKNFNIQNHLPDQKSNTVLAAWNPPADWGRTAMLRVDAKQGAPGVDGTSPIQTFEVEIWPLKIELTEAFYTVMWEYLFPKEGNRQESQEYITQTTATGKKGRRRSSAPAHTELSCLPVTQVMTMGPTLLADSEYFPSPTRSAVSATQSLPHALPPLHPSDAMAIQPYQLERRPAVLVSGPGKPTISLEHLLNNEAAAEAYLNAPPLSSRTKGGASGVNSGTSTPVAISGSHSTPLPMMHSSGLSATDVVFDRKSKDMGRRDSKGKPHEKAAEKATEKDTKKRSSRREKKPIHFNKINFSQVELLVTYQGSRFAITELRLLMDTFTQVEFTGTWRRLFVKLRKHIIWGCVKSVAGMQGKKFKDQLPQGALPENRSSADSDSGGSQSDSGASVAASERPFNPARQKRHSERAGESFVSSIKGIFKNQGRKAKAIVHSAMGTSTSRKDLDECVDPSDEEATGSDSQQKPHGSITKARNILRRGAKKFGRTASMNLKNGKLMRANFLGSPKGSPIVSEGEFSNIESDYADPDDM